MFIIVPTALRGEFRTRAYGETASYDLTIFSNRISQISQ